MIVTLIFMLPRLLLASLLRSTQGVSGGSYLDWFSDGVFNLNNAAPHRAAASSQSHAAHTASTPLDLISPMTRLTTDTDDRDAPPEHDDADTEETGVTLEELVNSP